VQFPKDSRNKVKRLAERGRYEAAEIYPIVDEALICHVGFVVDEQPFVIPTLHARNGDRILLHGSQASRMLRHLEAGGAVCITATIVDGLVLARSVFHHSVNYRSAVLYGHGERIPESEQYAALEVFMERCLPGRWAEARLPNEIEMKQTTVVSVPIESASAKVRSGPPKDDAEDMDWPIWAGVLPLSLQAGTPIPDAQALPGMELPDYLGRR
jgi:hypothetical protein